MKYFNLITWFQSYAILEKCEIMGTIEDWWFFSRGDTWRVDIFPFLYLWISSKSWSMPSISKPSWWESISLSWLWISFKHRVSNLVFPQCFFFFSMFSRNKQVQTLESHKHLPSVLYMLSHIIFYGSLALEYGWVDFWRNILMWLLNCICVCSGSCVFECTCINMDLAAREQS